MNNRGDISILASVILISIILTGSLVMSLVLSRQLGLSRNLANSEQAFYAAQTGYEEALYRSIRLGEDSVEIEDGELELADGTVLAYQATAGGEESCVSSSAVFRSARRQVAIEECEIQEADPSVEPTVEPTPDPGSESIDLGTFSMNSNTNVIASGYYNGRQYHPPINNPYIVSAPAGIVQVEYLSGSWNAWAGLGSRYRRPFGGVPFPWLTQSNISYLDENGERIRRPVPKNNFVTGNGGGAYNTAGTSPEQAQQRAQDGPEDLRIISFYHSGGDLEVYIGDSVLYNGDADAPVGPVRVKITAFPE